MPEETMPEESHPDNSGREEEEAAEGQPESSKKKNYTITAEIIPASDSPREYVRWPH